MLQFEDAWLITHTGIQFNPLNATVDMVDLEDIAHALAHICRFNGHTRYFYSVAEHSVHVSKLMPQRYQREALLHDAAEAYLMDVVTPLKERLHLVGQDGKTAYPYVWYEDKLREVIFKRFALTECMAGQISKRVDEMDKRLLVTEYRYFVCEEVPEALARIRPIKDYAFGMWSPPEAKAVFLQQARALGIE